jgi:hypothetical protein
VGETISDFFNTLIDPSANGSGLGYCAIIFFPLLFLTLLVCDCLSVFGWLLLKSLIFFSSFHAFQVQIHQKTYVFAVYWTAIVLTSICGTIFTDGNVVF